MELRHANALVDLVAVAENFSTKRLLAVHPELNDAQVSTWERRRKKWKNPGNIDLTTLTSNWHRLMGFVEARNAFQHGLGRLTDMQLGLRRDDILSDLESACISLTGDLVRVNGQTVAACYEVCEEFVIALDNQAGMSLPKIPLIGAARL